MLPPNDSRLSSPASDCGGSGDGFGKAHSGFQKECEGRVSLSRSVSLHAGQANRRHQCVSLTDQYSNSPPSAHRSPKKQPNIGVHVQRTTRG